jgi:hypothetical protein
MIWADTRRPSTKKIGWRGGTLAQFPLQVGVVLTFGCGDTEFVNQG